MHGTFFAIFQVSMISRACGNPAHINFLHAKSFLMLLLSPANFFQILFHEHFQSVSLDPDQNQLSVGPDLDPIC